MTFQYNDGGRKAAGFKGIAGDCVVRAISIALNLDYKTTYKQLAQANKDYGNEKSARNGLSKKVYIPFLTQHGWVWRSAPKFDGRKARCADMPKGVVIARQAHHLVAVIDGVPNDIGNPSHKMVYGYWAKV
jgi:hypothetical protein